MPTHIFVTLAIFSAIIAPQRAVQTESTVAIEEPPSTMPVPAAKSNGRAETAADREEILWLARIIYSETKIEPEMRLVGWVVRNRVETGFRGTTYKQVALSRNQFSGLNASDARYAHNISLDFSNTDNRSWTQAVAVAREVYFADIDHRPFPETVRHFYSPIAVAAPTWAESEKLYHTIAISTDKPARFAFYAGVK